MEFLNIVRPSNPIKKRCETCQMDEIWLSWSRLRSHEECKQKSYLNRTRQKAAIEDHRNFLPGNITDRVVRDWLLGDPWNNLDTMKDMVPEYLDKSIQDTKKQDAVIKWKGEDDKSNIIRDCTEAVTKIEPHLIKYVLPYEYTPDYAFKVPLQIEVDENTTANLVLNGYMDILVKHSESKYFIFDVKHTKDNNYWKKTIGQLSFYDTSLFLLTGDYSTYSGLLQPLCKDPIKPFNIQEGDRQKMWQSISNYATDVIRNNVEITNDVSKCMMCAYKHACPRFKPKMKNGKKVFSL